jgi:sec-independent protein translocase protein TatB
VFDLAPAKLLVVLVVALIVLGPEKLPRLAHQAGKAWADFRRFRAQLESEVRETFGDLPDQLAELRQLTSGSLSAVAAVAEHVVSSPAGAAAGGGGGQPLTPAGAEEPVRGVAAGPGSGDPGSGAAGSGGPPPFGLDDPAYN